MLKRNKQSTYYRNSIRNRTFTGSKDLFYTECVTDEDYLKKDLYVYFLYTKIGVYVLMNYGTLQSD